MVDIGVVDEASTAVVPRLSSLPVDLVCTVCGYGVAAPRAALTCPMCRSEEWEPASWRPFAAHLAEVQEV